MSFLLDTNVISETRRRRPDPNVIAWLESTAQQDLFVSVLTLGELAQGVARHRRKDAAAAASLDHWLTGIRELFADHVIPIDTETAMVWGRLNAERPLPVIDSLLAATALAHGHTLVTRNVKDVEGTGVSFVDPWERN